MERESKIVDEVEQQTIAILAARPFAQNTTPTPAPPAQQKVFNGAPPGLAHPGQNPAQNVARGAAPPAQQNMFAGAPPGLAHPAQNLAQNGAGTAAPPAQQNIFAGAPPGLAHPAQNIARAGAQQNLAQPAQDVSRTTAPAAQPSIFAGAPPGLAHPAFMGLPEQHVLPNPEYAGGQHTGTPVKRPGVGLSGSMRANMFASPAAPSQTSKSRQPGGQGATARFVEPARPTQMGWTGARGNAGPALADGVTPLLVAGATAGHFPRVPGAESTPRTVFKFNTGRRQQVGGVAQMPTPAQTPELTAFTPTTDTALPASSGPANDSQADFESSGFMENMTPVTPVRQAYQDDPDAMQVDEMLVATPFSVADTEDPSPCKGKGKKKEKKEHGGYMAGGWKSTDGGQGIRRWHVAQHGAPREDRNFVRGERRSHLTRRPSTCPTGSTRGSYAPPCQRTDGLQVRVARRDVRPTQCRARAAQQ